MATGKIVRWNTTGGYGWVKLEGGDEWFVHATAITPEPRRGSDLTGTDLFEVQTGEGRKGPAVLSALTREEFEKREAAERLEAEREAEEAKAERETKWRPMIEGAKTDPRLWLYGRAVEGQLETPNGDRFAAVGPIPGEEQIVFRLQDLGGGEFAAVSLGPLEDKSRYHGNTFSGFCQVCGYISTWMNSREVKPKFVRTGESEDGWRSEGYFTPSIVPGFCLDCVGRQEEAAAEAARRTTEPELAEANGWVGRQVTVSDFGRTIVVTIAEARSRRWREETQIEVRLEPSGVNLWGNTDWAGWRTVKRAIK